MTDIERLRELPAKWRGIASALVELVKQSHDQSVQTTVFGVARIISDRADELEAADLIALLADYERLRGMEERVKEVESLLRKSAAEHDEASDDNSLSIPQQKWHAGLSQAYEDGADMIAAELKTLVPVTGGEGKAALSNGRPDPADIIAGALGVSRGYAYDLMVEAIAERDK